MTAKTLPPRKRRLVSYLAGPYRDKRGIYYITKNIQEARDVSAVLWQLGFASICPHMNTCLLDGLEGCVDDTFLEGDLDMIERCDLLIAMPRWASSSGTRAEIAHAEACGIPVYYWNEDREELARLATAQNERRHVDAAGVVPEEFYIDGAYGPAEAADVPTN